MNLLRNLYNIRPQPSIPEKYFGNIQQRSKADVDSLMISLSGAIQGVQVNNTVISFFLFFFFPPLFFKKKNLLKYIFYTFQRTLFNIFNNIVRSSPSSKEAVLSYFARVIKLNEKRTQMQVCIQLITYILHLKELWLINIIAYRS